MDKRLFRVAIVFLAGLAVPLPSSAQWHDSLGGNWNNPSSALLGTMINNRLLARAAEKARERKSAPAAPSSPAVRENAPAPRLTFKPVARTLMTRELAGTLTKDAKSQQQLAAAFEEYLKQFDEQARKDREPSYDVGRAAAFFVMVNYFAATGREPTDAQADGAQAIFRSGLAENDGFVRMPDRDRQRLYESLVILGTFPLAAATQSAEEKNGEQEKMFRDFAAELVQTLLGVPVQKIRLTKTGFAILD